MSRSAKTKKKLLGPALKEAVRVLGLPEGKLARKVAMCEASTGTVHIKDSWGSKTLCGKSVGTMRAVEYAAIDAFPLCGSCARTAENSTTKYVFDAAIERYQSRVQALFGAETGLTKLERAAQDASATESDAALLQRLRQHLDGGGLNNGITSDAPGSPVRHVLTDDQLACEVGEEQVTELRERFSAILHEMARRLDEVAPKLQESASVNEREALIEDAALTSAAIDLDRESVEIEGVDWTEMARYRDHLVEIWLARSRISRIDSVEGYRSAFASTRIGATALSFSNVSCLPRRFRCDPSKFSSFQDLARAEFDAMWNETFAAIFTKLNALTEENRQRTETVYLVVDTRRYGRTYRLKNLSRELHARVTTVVAPLARNETAAVYPVPRVVAEALCADMGPMFSTSLEECSRDLAETVIGLIETGSENLEMAKWVSTAANLLAVPA